MEIIFGIIGWLVPLGLIGLLVYAIIQWRRRRGALESSDPGIGTVKRLYVYGVSFVSLMVAANGVVQIERYALDGLFGGDVLSPSRSGLAIGVALAIVALPLWLFHWRLAQRHVSRLPVETRSIIRKLYLYLVLGVAVGLLLPASVSALQWVFGSGDFSGYPWAAITVWAGVWAFHWRLESEEGQSTTETRAVRRLYIYVVSLATLVMAAVGIGHIIHIILREGYESAVSIPVLAPTQGGLWRDVMKTSLAVALAGGLGWWVHWHRFAGRELYSLLRQIYLYFFSLGGFVTVLVSAGLVLYEVLVWLMGVPGDDTASAHFRSLPAAIDSLSVGAALWLYHRIVVQREAGEAPIGEQDARRAYSYILAAIGLSALVVGVGVVVTNAIAIFVESARSLLAEPDFWRNRVAAFITLTVLGAPVWGYYWRSTQLRLLETGADERTSLVRRIFLFAALGVGALALLGSLSFLLFVFLRALLEGELGLAVLREAKTGIGILAAVAVFLPYHWLVYREDRRAEPDVAVATRPRKVVSVLVGHGAEAFLRGLEASLGYGVTALDWADAEAAVPSLTEQDLSDLASRVTEAEGGSVILVPDGEGVRVLSYS